MLQNTFLHLPGVGEHTERALWSAGIRDWKQYLAARREMLPRGVGLRASKSDVLLSVQKYQQQDWTFFDQCLKSVHKWRAFGDLPGRVLYVDIETDGTMNPDCITVLGAYDGQQAHLFVKDRNLQEAVDLLEAYPVIVTFNGARFDMPVIKNRFGYARYNHVHIDLLYPLRRLGYRGGLKAIEKELGIARSDETDGLSGWDAVLLWQEHLAGREEALQRLLRYNEEDVRNMEPLMHLVYERMRAGCGLAAS